MISLLLGLLPAASGVSLLAALIALFSPEAVVPWPQPRRVTAMLFYMALGIGFGAAASEAFDLYNISNSWLAMGGALAGLFYPYGVLALGRFSRIKVPEWLGARKRRTLSLNDDDDFDVIRAEWRAAARQRRENTAWADEQEDDDSILIIDPDRHGPVLEEMSIAARRLSGEGLHTEFQQAEKLFRTYLRFRSVLTEQFQSGEITADRFAGYAEQTIIGATANFNDILRNSGALLSLRETGGRTSDGERLQSNLKAEIETRIDENQTIISALGVATAELSALDTGSEEAGRRTDFALAELQRLSARTAEFVAREKART